MPALYKYCQNAVKPLENLKSFSVNNDELQYVFIPLICQNLKFWINVMSSGVLVFLVTMPMPCLPFASLHLKLPTLYPIPDSICHACHTWHPHKIIVWLLDNFTYIKLPANFIHQSLNTSPSRLWSRSCQKSSIISRWQSSTNSHLLAVGWNSVHCF